MELVFPGLKKNLSVLNPRIADSTDFSMSPVANMSSNSVAISRKERVLLGPPQVGRNGSFIPIVDGS
ncbi:hypothetical protein Hanom_Chr15g01400091 [Helianthus anomalus]